jgi:hypothetical protein
VEIKEVKDINVSFGHFVQEVTSFKTKDGTLFNTREEAEEHQGLCDFKEWYEENLLYGELYANTIDVNDFIMYLRINKETLKKFKLI